MKRWKCLLIIPICLAQVGCAALLTEPEYALINRPVDGKVTFHGEIYWLPERTDIRKIVLLGSGRIQNIEIHVRDEKNQWKLAKKVPGGRFPYEIPLTAETDAIKIIKLSKKEGVRIETVQFYTVADKTDAKR